MKIALDVLAVGSMEPMTTAYDVFLELRGCVARHVSSPRELTLVPSNVNCDIAILHHTLDVKRLRESSDVIRLRWPKARILLIRKDAWEIEDSSYDERVEPGTNPELLLSTIDRVLQRGHNGE